MVAFTRSRWRRTRGAATALVALGAVVALTSVVVAPGSGAATVAAAWSMTETSGTTMFDATSPAENGAIGASVGRTGSSYVFPAPNTTSADPSRLVRVNHSAALNPGTQPITIQVAVRTSSGSEHNLVQKGQSGSFGGFWKIEVNAEGATPGIAKCTFKGASGGGSVGSPVRVDDGVWHSVACRRAGSQISITVDGVTWTRGATTGAITNTQVLSIGGKASCRPPNVECDYYSGELADLQIIIG